MVVPRVVPKSLAELSEWSPAILFRLAFLPPVDITTILAGAYGARLLTMYFLDPQRGKRRRADLGDTLVHSKRELEKFAGRLGRDAENRTEGVLAEAQRLFQHVPTSDYVLEQRVHTALGRVVSHPSAIKVNAKDGSVFLTGWILTEEAKDVDRAVASIEGVKDFTSYLNTSTDPEHIPALQGGAGRKHVPELLQHQPNAEEWRLLDRYVTLAESGQPIGHKINQQLQSRR